MAVIILLNSNGVFAYTSKSAFSNDSLVVNSIIIKGNNKTNLNVINRELLFQVGDTLYYEDLHNLLLQSQLNLLKTSLFNFVVIDTVQNNNNIEVQINVEERWYLWPSFAVIYGDRNFNEWWQTKNLNHLIYGGGFRQENFRGRNEQLSFYLTGGLERSFGLIYNDIYVDKKRKHSLLLKYLYTERTDIVYNTFQNKPLNYKSSSGILYWNHEIQFSYKFRSQINNSHQIWLKYSSTGIGEELQEINPNFLGSNRNSLNYVMLYYIFRSDSRDSKNYPLQGIDFSVQLSNIIFEKSAQYHKNIYCVEGYFNNFAQISPRGHIAVGVNARVSYPNNQPFYLTQGFGALQYNLRGFEYYRIDGQKRLLIKALYKFTLIKPQIIQLDFFVLKKMEKFNKIHYALYCNLFADAGYVSDETNNYILFQNNYVNQLIYSYGIGIDLETYYDKVVRLEYSITKYGEAGIFLHFLAPI